MKTINIVSTLLISFSLLACGSGGGSKQDNNSVSSVRASSSQPSSSSAPASSSSVASSASSIASSSSSSYPSYNTNPLEADSTGMGSNAVELAAKLKLGWNIGNTLEAGDFSDPLNPKKCNNQQDSETCWGNPKITEDYVKFVKQSGFNAIRLPVSWNQYASVSTAEIEQAWLDRVKQVVKYCIDNDLYVLVNIHWDGGWLENHVSPDKQFANNAKQKAFWEQIATHLREFDERLMFASSNEPSVKEQGMTDVDLLTQRMNVLTSYHQTFIDAVRSTGGKNAYRVLVIQGPNTDVELTHQLMNSMPTDTIANRLMVEIHYYTPWNFTGMTKDEGWGNQFYYWGKNLQSTTDTAHNPTWGEEATVDEMFGLMKSQFVDKGIPVVVGEYGTQKRNNLTGDDLALHLASRAYFLKYVTQQALAYELIPFYWDTGGILSRSSNTVLDQQALDGLIQGGSSNQ